MSDALPLMIKAAAVNFGRDTPLPVTLNATDEFVGRVELGDTRVLDDEPPAPGDLLRRKPSNPPSK